tara:strand:+ start:574 stop:1122 length:549 start_codon:yes stop_codon:yes gene_type:complete
MLDGIEIVHRPYQLSPRLPKEGRERRQATKTRHGDNHDSAEMPEHLFQEASEEGIELNYEKIHYVPNTENVHLLIERARQIDRANELVDLFFEAYFSLGLDLREDQLLIDIGTSIGLTAEDVTGAIKSPVHKKELVHQRERAEDFGISGVPGFLLDNRYVIPGTQSAETLSQILRRVLEKVA